MRFSAPWMTAGCALTMLIAGRAGAMSPSEQDHRWVSTTPPSGLDGEVHALAVHNGLLIVGGDFSRADDVYLNHIGGWDGSEWQSMGAGFNSRVRSIHSHGGKIYAGGDFSISGAESTSSIAEWTGTSWKRMGNGLSAAVQAMTSYQGHLIVGGLFRYSGKVSCYVQPWDLVCRDVYTEPRHFTASWDGTSWRSLGLPEDESGLSTAVDALAVFQDHLYAGGLFRARSTRPGAQNDNFGLASWGDSLWQLSGPILDSQVRQGAYRSGFKAFATYDGKLHAGGVFRHMGMQAVSPVVAWNGTTWEPLGDRLHGTVTALTVHGDVLVAGGKFTTSGPSGFRVIYWDGSRWIPMGDDLNGTVRALADCNGTLYAGGRFTLPGTEEFYLARWNGFEWVPVGGTPAPPVVPLPISRLASLGDSLFCVEPSGASYTFPQPPWPLHEHHARASSWDEYRYPAMPISLQGGFMYGSSFWDGHGWRPLPYPPIPEWQWGVQAFPFRGGMIAFSKARSSPVTGYQFDGESWRYIPGLWLWPPDGNRMSQVRDGVEYRGGIVVAGCFSNTDDDFPVHHIASWDGSAWSDLGGGTDDIVMDVEIYHGDLIAGGWFQNAGNTQASYLARWDGSQWSPLGPGTDGPVFALRIYNDRLIVAGTFSRAGGQAAGNIAAWDGVGWIPLGAGTDGEVHAIAQHQGDLFVGGEFSTAGGRTSIHLARWHEDLGPPSLSVLEATRVENWVDLHWQTESLPLDHLGFHVYRETPEEERVRLTSSPITTGAEGTFRDEDPSLVAATYWIAAEGVTGKTTWYGSTTATQNSVLMLSLGAAAPNPFLESTEIRFRIGQRGHVVITVFDVAGREVSRIVDETLEAGEFNAVWDGRRDTGGIAASGVYFYRIDAPEGSLVKRLVKA